MRRWILVLSLLCAGTGGVSGQTAPIADSAAAPPHYADAPKTLTASDIRLHRLFVRGLTKAQLDEHEAAIEFFTQALDLAPGSPDIAAALAASHQALGNTSSALHYARLAAASRPGNAFYQIQLARLYRASGDADASISAYQAALSHRPRDEAALIELAQMLAASGDYRQSVEMYERLLLVRGEARDIREQTLNLYTMLNDSAGVRLSLQALLHLEPSSMALRQRLSQLYQERKQPEKAALLFEQLLAADPTHAEAARALAELRGTNNITPPAGTREETTSPSRPAPLGSLDERPDARHHVQALAEVHKGESDAPGSALTNLEQAVLEAETCARRLDSDPRDLDLWVRTAYAFRRAGDVERAKALLDDALLLFPGQPSLLAAAGFVLLDMDRPREAAEHLDNAAAFAAESVADDAALVSTILTGKALVADHLAIAPRADSLFQKAIEVHPENIPALAHFATSLARRELHTERAISLARQAAALAPHHPAAAHALGHAYLVLGDTRQAIEWLKKSIALGSTDSATFRLLGDSYESIGDTIQAQYFWQEASRLDPNSRTDIEKAN